MNHQNNRIGIKGRWISRKGVWKTIALASLFISGLLRVSGADVRKSKQTACFWQRDPKADFDNEGRNHCAPVAISDGLVYLTTTRGFEDLVDSTDHEGQIDLINELAEAMDTDPQEGTNPDKILTGLVSYVKERGYSFERLELSTWRGVSSRNKKYLVGTKPNLNWLTAAAKDPDVVQIFNFGWYHKGSDGSYTRRSGHWVNVVGTGPQALQFSVHNPMLQPARQKTDTGIVLKRVDNNFVMASGNGKKTNMTGYYQAEGPGLPFNKKRVSAAVLDAVIVFKIKEE
jgi:hypothetical protein